MHVPAVLPGVQRKAEMRFTWMQEQIELRRKTKAREIDAFHR